MDIVYSSSDSYCEIAGISILSLLEHNRNVKELNLYLIDFSREQAEAGGHDCLLRPHTDVSGASGH